MSFLEFLETWMLGDAISALLFWSLAVLYPNNPNAPLVRTLATGCFWLCVIGGWAARRLRDTKN